MRTNEYEFQYIRTLLDEVTIDMQVNVQGVVVLNDIQYVMVNAE